MDMGIATPNKESTPLRLKGRQIKIINWVHGIKLPLYSITLQILKTNLPPQTVYTSPRNITDRK
jgi:hypothetical protein